MYNVCCIIKKQACAAIGSFRVRSGTIFIITLEFGIGTKQIVSGMILIEVASEAGDFCKDEPCAHGNNSN